MIKKVLLSVAVSVMILSVPAQASTTKIIYVHTFQNVAIYNNGVLTDEDGEVFKKDFNVPNDSVVLVTYNNKNTVTRLDDEPISAEIVKEKK